MMHTIEPIDCPNGHTNCLVKRPGARCVDLSNEDAPECAMTHKVALDDGARYRALKDALVCCDACSAFVIARKDVGSTENYFCDRCSP